MSDCVKNEDGDEASAESSLPQSGCIKGSANDVAGKCVELARAIGHPFHMSDSAENVDGSGDGKTVPSSMQREADHVYELFGDDGPVLMPFNPNGTFEDPDYSNWDETEEEAVVCQVPEAGDGRRTIFVSMLQFDPDYIQLAAKLPKLTLQEVQEMNKNSGVFKLPIEQVEIPIRDLADFVVGFVKQLDPLMVWQLVSQGDGDITTTALHPILHEKFMPEMRKRGNLSTRTLKNLKFGLLEVLVLTFRNGYHFNGMSGAGVSDHSRFGYSVTYRLVQPILDVLDKCRAETNQRLYAIADDRDRERRDQHASPTRNEEDDVNLPHKRKTEVFMNGVVERRKCGTMFEYCDIDKKKLIRSLQVHFEQLIQLRKGDRQRVLEFFDANPDLSAKDLLDLLDECLQVHRRGVYSEGFKKTLFFAHRGVSISFLLNNLEKIYHDLQSQEWRLSKIRSLCIS